MSALEKVSNTNLNRNCRLKRVSQVLRMDTASPDRNLVLMEGKQKLSGSLQRSV